MIENLAQIKEQINIIEVLQSYIPLKKMGSNYISICPFHTENTPSLVVSRKKGKFHCFGCNEGGNAIDFVMKYEHIDFIEAIKKCSNICNIEVKEIRSKKSIELLERKQELQERLKRLNISMRNNLLRHEKLVSYLLKRGFKYEVIEQFGLGLALSKNQVIDILGLANAKELGFITDKGYNFFENRLMITLFDSNNNIVGFSGRIHDYNNFTKSPKYINSKDSLLYKKSDILYNLGFARTLKHKSIEGIKEKNVLFIVEGYFDSISLTLLGIPSIAICGTALNPTYLKNIMKYFSESKIYIALDSDNAGREASIRAYKVFLEYGFVDVKIARLKGDYKDVNECFSKGEALDFKFYEGLDFALRVELSQGSIKERQERLKYYATIYKKQRDYFVIEYMRPYMQRYFIQRQEKLKTTNESDEESILTQLAQDNTKRFIAEKILSSEDFSNKEAFLDIMSNKQSSLYRQYELKECREIANDLFYKIILRFKIEILKYKRNKALYQKPFDKDYILALNNKIDEMNEHLKIQF